MGIVYVAAAVVAVAALSLLLAAAKARITARFFAPFNPVTVETAMRITSPPGLAYAIDGVGADGRPFHETVRGFNPIGLATLVRGDVVRFEVSRLDGGLWVVGVVRGGKAVGERIGRVFYM